MRLRTFYFLYYAATGIILGYVPPYLRSLDLDGRELAVALSIQPLLAIAIPLGWGWLADRTGRTVDLLRVACIFAAAGFSLLHFAGDFRSVAVVLAVYALFATAIVSLADSVAVVDARRQGIDYSRIRLWGSVGFIASAWSFGVWLDRGGRASDAVSLAAALMAGVALSALRLPEAAVEAGRIPPSAREVGSLLRRPALALFLVAAMLHWAALAPYHLFFAIHVGDLGAAPSYVGLGFGLAVAVEVGTMWRFSWLRERLSLESILLLCFAAGGIRWLLSGFAQTGVQLAVIQLLHGLGFGAFFVASIAWLEREVPERLRATGRALYASVVFGVGGVGGNLLAGSLYDVGGGRLAFLTAAAIELVPFVLIAVVLRHWDAAARSRDTLAIGGGRQGDQASL